MSVKKCMKNMANTTDMVDTAVAKATFVMENSLAAFWRKKRK